MEVLRFVDLGNHRVVIFQHTPNLLGQHTIVKGGHISKIQTPSFLGRSQNIPPISVKFICAILASQPEVSTNLVNVRSNGESQLEHTHCITKYNLYNVLNQYLSSCLREIL